MAVAKMSSREFNQDTGRAKRTARSGPVYVTDRGRVSHVLLCYEHYMQLGQNRASVVDRLAGPPGAGDVVFEVPTSPDHAQPATFG